MGDLFGVGGSPHLKRLRDGLITSIALSTLFVVVYGGTNWWTAQRPAAEVGTWFMDWELKLVPFVALLIVPYMSVDLFFFGAALLCESDEQRRVFARRVVFAIAVATTFFVLMPLRLAWPARPVIPGWFGQFVEASCRAPLVMEFPHNLFPSLHVTLCTLLADHYSRHTRGVMRRALQVWFFLIAISTWLTWQHHLVDLAGGLLLAAFAFHLFRESSEPAAVVPDYRIGARYAGGAAALALVVPWCLPWGVFLLWPAASLALAAAGYWGLGPWVYHKSQGRLPLSSLVVMGPLVVGHYLSLLYYRRRSRPFDMVGPGVAAGRRLAPHEAEQALAQGVRSVLDLTAELPAASPLRHLPYRNVPVLDLTSPTREQLEESLAFIRQHVDQGVVLVHCKVGYSRTAAVVGAYLLATGQADDAEEALRKLQQARPGLIIRPETRSALTVYHQHVVVGGGSGDGGGGGDDDGGGGGQILTDLLALEE
ncbi:MAG: phosphatase PAP2/dual specificity phosphatase family protein [Pirellulales bacterium]